MVDISVIGTGCLGKALLHQLYECPGFVIKSVYNRSPEKAEKEAEKYGAEFWGAFPETFNQLGKVTFLTVPDDQIQTAASYLAKLPEVKKERVIVHCSGVYTTEILSALKSDFVYKAAFHPLQTFSKYTGNPFEGIYCSFQGDKKAKKYMNDMSKNIGAQIFNISKDTKPYVHAAAVMASNYLITLLYAAEQTMKQSGQVNGSILPKLMPLIEKSLYNSLELGPSKAISGPIARNDPGTVEEHLKLMDDAELKNLYKELGRYTLSMVKQRQQNYEQNADSYRALRKLFEEG